MARKKKLKKGAKRLIRVIILIAFAFILAEVIEYYYESTKTYVPYEEYKEDYYYAYDFGFIDQKSNTDYNNNGNDDYEDILIGLKNFAKRNPKYVSKYYDNGYPPENEGVCTDTIVEAIDNAGYNLKDLINKDIKNNKKEYSIEIIDGNIDYRRVNAQRIFFEKYVKQYSTNYEDIIEFNPGDILVFEDDEHIAMVSDKRNAKGIPYLIQNRDETQEEKEEDRLEISDMKISYHFRFNYNEKLEKLINKK